MPRPLRPPLYVALLCWAAAAGASELAIDAGPPVGVVRAEVPALPVGVGGFVRPGAWAPLGPATGGGAVVRVTDGDGLTLSRPVRFGAGGWAVFQAGRAESDVTVDFGGVVWTLRPGEDFTVLAPDERLWAAVNLPPALRRPDGGGDDAGPLDRPDRPVRVAAFDDAADLPAAPGALDTVRVLLADAADLPADSGFLRDWVAGGGHLVLSLSETADPPDWLPLTAGAPVPLTNRAALEQVAKAGSGRGTAAVINRLVPAVARPVAEEEVRTADGRVLARGEGGALVAEVPLGFGRVTAVGVSLHAAPLSGWAGLPAFLAEVVRRAPGAAPAEGAAAGELAGQVYAALEPEGGGGLSPGAVGVWALVLLAVVGPLDYLLVHRVLNRPALTWVTLPVWLGAAAGLAWTAAPDATAEPRRFELVDVDAAAGRARGTAWATVPAPAAGRATVRFAPADLPETSGVAARLGYAAEPGATFGGLYRGGGVGFVPGDYRIEGVEAVGVPLPERAAKRFRLDWAAAAPGLFAASLTDAGGTLRGTLSHRLPGALTDFVLVYGGRAYRPDPARVRIQGTGGELRPGEAWRADDPGVLRRDLRGFLTQVREVREGGGAFGNGAYGEADPLKESRRLVRTRYDARSRDFGAILPVLSFYDRAGGAAFAGLSNAELEPLDLSPLAGGGRAVLLGRLDAPLTTLATDFGPDDPIPAGPAETWVRAVLPVAGGEPEPSAEPPPAFRGPLRIDPDAVPAPRPRREGEPFDFGA